MKTIIELAREAGFTELEFYGNKLGTNPTECLERFAALIRADEREACAKVCEDHFSSDGDWCAKVIRARGNT
jgi:hypothetical protein